MILDERRRNFTMIKARFLLVLATLYIILNQYENRNEPTARHADLEENILE